MHQALDRQADGYLAHRRITRVAQVDEQTGAVVHQPRLERLGEQLGIRRLGQFDQPVDLLMAQLALADTVDAPLQLLVLQQLAGLADPLAELARVSEVGIGQGGFQARAAFDHHIGHQHDHQANQQRYEAFPDFVPAQHKLPSVVVLTIQAAQGCQFRGAQASIQRPSSTGSDATSIGLITVFALSLTMVMP
ncbi:hypothetical protein D3C80_1356670 [compost metagenome]